MGASLERPGHPHGQAPRRSGARLLARPGRLARDAHHAHSVSRLTAARDVAGRPLEALAGLDRHARLRLTPETTACYETSHPRSRRRNPYGRLSAPGTHRAQEAMP